jgi:hypothetical protein
MKTARLIMAGFGALSLLVLANAQAEETAKQSASSRQASKARDYANRQDKEGPPDVAAATSVAGQKEGEKMPVLDSPVVEKAAKDTGDNWKKMERVLDRF